MMQFTDDNRPVYCDVENNKPAYKMTISSPKNNQDVLQLT